MESMMENGMSIISSAWTWISSNPIVGGVLGVAVFFVAVGAFVGLFIRRS